MQVKDLSRGDKAIVSGTTFIVDRENGIGQMRCHDMGGLLYFIPLATFCDSAVSDITITEQEANALITLLSIVQGNENLESFKDKLKNTFSNPTQGEYDDILNQLMVKLGRG